MCSWELARVSGIFFIAENKVKANGWGARIRIRAQGIRLKGLTVFFLAPCALCLEPGCEAAPVSAASENTAHSILKFKPFSSVLSQIHVMWQPGIHMKAKPARLKFFLI
jgi:hypothetical protein